MSGPEQWHDGQVKLTKWTTAPKRIAPEDSIFITVKGAGVGKMVLGTRAAIGRDVYAFEPSSHMERRFVFWAIKHSINRIVLQAQGDIPGLSKDVILDHEIAVPSRSTQQATVERIETLFAEIDAGVESLRAARRALGLYRRSLLNAAFEGRLTADWRAANPDLLETPDALLARIRAKREARHAAALAEWEEAVVAWEAGRQEGQKPGRPKRPAEFRFHKNGDGHGWPLIETACLLADPLGNGRSVKDRAGGFLVLRLTAMRNGGIDYEEAKEGDWSEADAKPFCVAEGDIFLARGNGSKRLVGLAAIASKPPDPVAFPDTMIRVRLDASTVHPQYFLHAWNGPIGRQQIENAARTTAGIYKINQDHVGGIVLPLCSPAEQAEIVRILDARLSAADALAAEIDAGLKRADALRQSILTEAFAGRLAPQDPDAEPAADLLARIRADRAAAPKPTRRRKSKATA